MGCGPGLYAERLHKKGYNITGIDFSQRSINYARKKARERNQEINYVYKNYMDINYKNEFEIVILIYCDFGVLSDIRRQVLLKKIYESLKPGGKFIFDVFTLKEFEKRKRVIYWC